MLTAVSLGPGDESLLTPAARQAIAQADVVAGYKGYI
ncbi:MAG: precorrin-3B C(17)-methyltransferase, partial [Proteobacteria bacterium]|nr:precorrin-3B C(17)-methyltransferase [Pseudomonadota bacterium]